MSLREKAAQRAAVALSNDNTIRVSTSNSHVVQEQAGVHPLRDGRGDRTVNPGILKTIKPGLGENLISYGGGW